MKTEICLYLSLDFETDLVTWTTVKMPESHWGNLEGVETTKTFMSCKEIRLNILFYF